MYNEMHKRIERWYLSALKVVEPEAAVINSMSWNGQSLVVDGSEIHVDEKAQVLVISVGKAASAMARGAVSVLGDRIGRGIVLTKYGHLDGEIERFRSFEAGHPIPDGNGARATREIVEALKGLTSEDVVVALVSGGGSALLELPREPLTLQDLQVTTEMLMHAGAGIHDLNTVRSVLSQVKGGGLRRAMGDARCVSLLLSDVLGNDPEVIASGPTVRGNASLAKARSVVGRYGVEERLPGEVQAALRGEDRSERAPDDKNDVCSVIADNAAMVSELQRIVKAEGLSARLQWPGYEGEAADLGRMMVKDALDSSEDLDVLLGGGEATVEVTGTGRGGRNTEAALAAAIALEQGGGWVIASLASDGDDGAADAAGAVADPGTISRGRSRGVDPFLALADNDSATYFREAGGLVVTGPSGTNVNDVYIALRTRHAPGQGTE